jgi:hypothetical protein
MAGRRHTPSNHRIASQPILFTSRHVACRSTFRSRTRTTPRGYCARVPPARQVGSFAALGMLKRIWSARVELELPACRPLSSLIGCSSEHFARSFRDGDDHHRRPVGKGVVAPCAKRKPQGERKAEHADPHSHQTDCVQQLIRCRLARRGGEQLENPEPGGDLGHIHAQRLVLRTTTPVVGENRRPTVERLSGVLIGGMGDRS